MSKRKRTSNSISHENTTGNGNAINQQKSEMLVSENDCLRQEIERLRKELASVKGELLKHNQNPNKDKVIAKLKRENAILRRENHQLYISSRGFIVGVIRKTSKSHKSMKAKDEKHGKLLTA